MSDKAAKFQAVFDLIDKAGGPKLPDLKSFSFGERMKVVFNVWGFLFGPIYYFYHGMWKKGLTLLGISLGMIFIIVTFTPSLTVITNFICPAIFATRANIDLYKKYKLNDDSWF
jgi:hypothetical protein